MNLYKYIFAASLLSIAGCSKIVDKTSYSKLNSEDIWNNESTALTYFNGLYSAIMPVNPANSTDGIYLPGRIHYTSDEMGSPASTTILYGQVVPGTIVDFGTTSSTAYTNVRTVNVVLRDIDAGAMPQDAKDRLKGQAYFFRAWIYFNLTKLYGGVPYIKEAQDYASDGIYVTRTATSTCFANIASDLDSAVYFLNKGNAEPSLTAQTVGNVGRITRGAAMALKGRALLHWASPQFNPGNDQARWTAAYQANKEAYDQLIADGYQLHSDFSTILTNETNKERILIRSYDGNTTSGRYNSMENSVRPVSAGGSGSGYQPTWDLVTAFLDTNGKRITESTVYNDTFYWMKRDPRFRATIVWNGSVWPLGGSASRKQWIYTGDSSANGKGKARYGTNPESSISSTGFYYRKGVNAATAAAQSQFGTVDWVEIRLAEVMLNLAECANYTGRQSEAADMIIQLRQRAGIVPGSDGRYGLDAGLSTAQMFDVIINERWIEMAFENKRYDDLRRNKLFTTMLEGKKRQRIVVKPASPFADTVLNTVVSGTTYVRDTVNIWNKESVRKFFTFTVSDYETTPITFDPRCYYYPLPPETIKNNPKLVQTTGWTGGTFDPLQ